MLKTKHLKITLPCLVFVLWQFQDAISQTTFQAHEMKALAIQKNREW